MKCVNEDQGVFIYDRRDRSPVAFIVFNFKLLYLCILINFEGLKLFIVQPLTLKVAVDESEDVFHCFLGHLFDLFFKCVELRYLHHDSKNTIMAWT